MSDANGPRQGLRVGSIRPHVALVTLDRPDWLLSCPEAGWLRPLDRSETTDDVKPPRLG